MSSHGDSRSIAWRPIAKAAGAGVFLLAAAAAARGGGLSNAEAVAGAWVLQQTGSLAELERMQGAIEAALELDGVVGFSQRAPWKSIDESLELLEAGKRLADRKGKAYSLRFMAGRHTPARVFEVGCPHYLNKGEKVPAPFGADGSTNAVFEREYDAFVARLAQWCRANEVRLLHLAWYGQEWAELNHGKEVRALPGYSFENWLEAHKRLIDIGLKYADESLAVELPFSGYGPLTEAAAIFADHVIARIGPGSPLFFCQANGWGPNGEWGAPSAEVEKAFDAVWAKPIRRGLQMIQPRDYDWPIVFSRLYESQADYCEVYTPSFGMERRSALFEEIRKFGEARRAALERRPENERATER